MNIFIDDWRNPTDIKWPKALAKTEWTVVRSYREFCKVAETAKKIDIVSFDYDLKNSYGEDEKENALNNGMNCIGALVEICIDKRQKLPTCVVHSAHPKGRKEMEDKIKYMSSRWF